MIRIWFLWEVLLLAQSSKGIDLGSAFNVGWPRESAQAVASLVEETRVISLSCWSTTRAGMLVDPAIDAISTMKSNQMRRFLFELVKDAQAEVYMAYVCWTSSTFIGYYNYDLRISDEFGMAYSSTRAASPVNKNFTFAGLDSSCTRESGFCGDVWTTDDVTGTPQNWHAPFNDYDCRQRSWYKDALKYEAGMTSVYSFFSGGLGVTGFLTLRDSHGDVLGVSAWDFRLSEISIILESMVNKIILIAVEDLEPSIALIDLSAKNPYLLALSNYKEHGVTNAETGESIIAVNSTDAYISQAALALEARGWPNDKVIIQDSRFVYMLSVELFQRDNFTLKDDWHLMLSYRIICSQGTYESEFHESCIPCPPDRTNIPPHQISCNLCVAGKYLDERDDTCHDCPSHTECTEPGVTLKKLPLEKGYMRMNIESNEITHCIGSNSKARPGNPATCPGGNNPLDVPCAPSSHHIGPRCELCAKHYFVRGDHCKKCAKNLRSVAVLVPIIIYVLVVLGLIWWLAHVALKQTNRGSKYARLQAKIRTKWKILFVALQILSSLALNLECPLPSAIHDILSIFTSLSALDITLLVPFSCFNQNSGHSASSYHKILFLTMLPFTLVLALYTHVKVALRVFQKTKNTKPAIEDAKENTSMSADSRTSAKSEPTVNEMSLTRHQIYQSAVSMAVLIGFCLYPTVSSAIVHIFRRCEGWDPPRISSDSRKAYYLVGDANVRCYTRSFYSYRIYCGLMSVIWIIGLPLAYFVELYKYRAHLDPIMDGGKRARMSDPGGYEAVTKAMHKRMEDPAISHLVVLFSPYEPYYWFWEIVECFRRLLATAITGLVMPGSYNQFFFALLVGLATLKLASYYQPFYEDSDDTLFEGLAWMVVFSQIIALNLRIQQTRSTMSPLTIAFLVVVFGAVAWGVIFIAVDAHRERALLSMLRKDFSDVCKDATQNASSKLAGVAHSAHVRRPSLVISPSFGRKRDKAENKQRRRAANARPIQATDSRMGASIVSPSSTRNHKNVSQNTYNVSSGEEKALSAFCALPTGDNDKLNYIETLNDDGDDAQHSYHGNHQILDNAHGVPAYDELKILADGSSALDFIEKSGLEKSEYLSTQV